MSLMQHHLQPDALTRALEHGFEDEDRLRALIHFGGGCPECRQTFDQLPLPDGVNAPQHIDPIAWALHRLQTERTESAAPVRRMTPIHLAWVERAMHEPNAFARLVIEEAMLLEFNRGPAKSTILEQLLALLSDHRWMRPGDLSRRDLKTVAWIYLESVRSCWRKPAGRGVIHAVAKRRLAYGSGDHEIHAVCYLHQARIECRGKFLVDVEAEIRLARRHLDRFFEARSSPYHLAELWYVQAFDYHRRQQDSSAYKAFTKALRTMPRRCLGYYMDVLFGLAVLREFEISDLQKIKETLQ